MSVKTNAIKSILVLMSWMLAASVYSQNKVQYNYDLNGNRIQKVFVGYRISKPGHDTTYTLPPSVSAIDSAKRKADNLALEYLVSVFPNPTNGKITVSMQSEFAAEKGGAIVRLLDNMGKEIDRRRFNSGNLEFDISSAPPGNYFMQVIFENRERITYQIIKVN